MAIQGNTTPFQIDPNSSFNESLSKPHEIPAVKSPFFLQIIVSILLITGIFLFALLIAYTTILQKRFETDKRSTPNAKIVLPTGTKKGASGGCIISGCNSELCVEKDSELASICVYKEEFACYKEASCTRLSSGKCGWIETEDLKSCLASP